MLHLSQVSQIQIQHQILDLTQMVQHQVQISQRTCQRVRTLY